MQSALQRTPSRDNPRLIFNDDNYILDSLEQLISILELDSAWTQENNDTPINITPNFIKGIVIIQEDGRICIFDKKYRIKLQLTINQFVTKVYHTMKLDYFINLNEHMVVIIKPAIDIKISLVKKDFYAVSFVLMCDDFEKDKKISNSQGTPVYNFYKTKFLENDFGQNEKFVELFKEIELIEKMKVRLAEARFYEAENLEDFYKSYDYLLLSNINCEKTFPEIAQDEFYHISGYIYINGNYEFFPVEDFENVESAGNSLCKESQNSKKLENYEKCEKNENSQNSQKLENRQENILNLNSHIEIEKESAKKYSLHDMSFSQSKENYSPKKDEKNVSGEKYNCNREDYQEHDYEFSFHDDIINLKDHYSEDLGKNINNSQSQETIIQDQTESVASKESKKGFEIEWTSKIPAEEIISSAGNSQNSSKRELSNYSNKTSEYISPIDYEKSNFKNSSSNIEIDVENLPNFGNLNTVSNKKSTEKKENKKPPSEKIPNNNAINDEELKLLKNLKDKFQHRLNNLKAEDFERLYIAKNSLLYLKGKINKSQERDND
jgi:hypothetical protein